MYSKIHKRTHEKCVIFGYFVNRQNNDYFAIISMQDTNSEKHQSNKGLEQQNRFVKIDKKIYLILVISYLYKIILFQYNKNVPHRDTEQVKQTVGVLMGSHSKTIGIIGEQVLISEFIKKGFNVLTPIGDNLPYDFVVELEGRFIKIQVKTTEKVIDGCMIFQTNHSNPYTRVNHKYSKSEIDYFGLYCIENGFIGLIPIEECDSKAIKLRMVDTKNHQRKHVRFASDYQFDLRTRELS